MKDVGSGSPGGRQLKGEGYGTSGGRQLKGEGSGSPGGFYWERAGSGARLLRVFGRTAEVLLPGRVAGLPLTELGAYCFARDRHLPGRYEKYFPEADPGEERRAVAGRESCGGRIAPLPNGTPLSDVPWNGVPSKGVAFNGATSKGVTSNGATSKDLTSNGAASKGLASDGVLLGSVTFNGATSKGLASNGAFLDGVASNGLTADSMPCDGMTRECGESRGAFGIAPSHGETLSGLRELAGSYVERISLPDSLEKIGNFAFYGCTRLAELSLGGGAVELGGDAFMNCQGLHAVTVRCSIKEKSGIQRLLAQIPWEVEVTFQKDGKTEARLLFPEYTESYDEIAPAHLFGRNIEGEGFRARQCFDGGVAELARYDAVFPKACVKEDVGTLCRMALCRLRYPADLGEAAGARYARYVEAHEEDACRMAVGQRDAMLVRFLCENGLVSRDALEKCVLFAAGAGWAQGAAYFLQLEEDFFPGGGEDGYAF